MHVFVLHAKFISSHSYVDSIVHRSCVHRKGKGEMYDIWIQLSLVCLLPSHVVSFLSTNLPTSNEQEIKL